MRFFSASPMGLRARTRRAARVLRWCMCLWPAWLVACGGSGGGGLPLATTGLVMPTVQAVSIASPDGQTADAPTQPVPTGASMSSTSSTPLPPPDPGLLLLLLPDGQDRSDPRVGAWVDAALEEGVRLQPLSDSEFLALGSAAQGYAGLVLPDGLHTVASDELLAAVSQYTEAGGKTLLSFDFGALTLLNDVPVYPIPKSRLSAMAGVDYVLYEQLRERTTGLGPVTGLRSTLRHLLVPPGKSMAFSGLSSSGTTLLAAADVSSGNSLLEASGITAETALYLPVSPADPGGVRGFDVQQYSEQAYYSTAAEPSAAGAPRQVKINLGQAKRAAPPAKPSKVKLSPSASTNTRVTTALSTYFSSDPVEAWTGYLLGPLIYPSYVTQGDFGQLPGQRVLASSPQFGLVAGVNPVGAGRALFVNLPLTYLKGRTDALMMHGFMHYFVHEVLQLPHLSSMPNGVAGITLDWHLDSISALAPTNKLMKLDVFNDPAALFSIEMTAGPDAVLPGDALGWNLPKNKVAQQFMRSFASAGHAVGSHGGWIHDYYGLRAGDASELQTTEGACVNTVLRIDNYQQCLVLNRKAVDGTVGMATTGYSAPEGNNPLWAMNWLEQQGVVAAYFGGHTGLGATRQYREGTLLNPAIWVFPVTPQGLYATFEEFQAYGVPKSDVAEWYHDLIDFNIDQNTSRMVYAHPPGAVLWSGVLLDFLSYAKAQGSRLSWYSTVRLARFMAQRQAVNWNQSLDAATGQTVFSATHPSNLAEMAWRLPREQYPHAPQLVSGTAVVDDSDPCYWLVRATGGTQLVFRA